jgi:GT2 family glycosyltransferase
MHQLEIGVCSYRNPEALKRALDSIHTNTVQPFTLRIWHNATQDKENDDARRAIESVKCERTISENVGYAGAVNGMLAQSTAPYFLYCDNDIEVQTRGWDEQLMDVLENNPECAQVFPGTGHYGFYNGRYNECLWNAGYCWMLKRTALFPNFRYPENVSGTPQVMDCSLGHHEEVDLMVSLRLAGFTIGCVPDVRVLHHETASSSQSFETKKRIHAGVVRFMNKWNRYFCGDVLKYPDPDQEFNGEHFTSGEGYDPRMLRYTDWPPCALYLERWTLAQFPEWNSQYQGVALSGMRIVQTSVGEMDAIEVLKPKGFYRGRAI